MRVHQRGHYSNGFTPRAIQNDAADKGIDKCNIICTMFQIPFEGRNDFSFPSELFLSEELWCVSVKDKQEMKRYCWNYVLTGYDSFSVIIQMFK